LTSNTSNESLKTDGSFEVLSSLAKFVFGSLELFLGPGLDLCYKSMKAPSGGLFMESKLMALEE